jgi:outer membrane protein assembly factor BamB
VYSNGELFVRASSVVPRNPIFNADTGAITGSSRATRAPAFSQATGFHLENGSLRAIDQAERNELWTFAGDGRLITAPIVIDDIVVIGSSRGNIYALDGVEGTVLWSDSTGANIEDPDEFTIRRPLIGLGAGEGYLVVPASNVLTAWRLVP